MAVAQVIPVCIRVCCLDRPSAIVGLNARTWGFAPRRVTRSNDNDAQQVLVVSTLDS